MNNYVFILGRQPYLSTAEIAAFLERLNCVFQLKVFSKEALLVEVEEELDTKLFSQLGGTIKVVKLLSPVRKDNFGPEFDTFLNKTKLTTNNRENKKIHFGLSFYALSGKGKVFKFFRKWVKTLNKQIKDHLTANNLRSAFVQNKTPVLSSVSVAKNKLLTDGFELVFFLSEEDILIGKTIWVQDFTDFGFRDYGRPQRDDRVGMLPPKLARLMINLARFKKSDNLLDPFCGSGTILTEAVLLGLKNLAASDYQPAAIKRTQANLAWLLENYPQLTASQLNLKTFTTDIKQLPVVLTGQTVDLIVTEPDLGSPMVRKFNKVVLNKEIERLEQLYIDFFQAARQILSPKGKVVIVLPVYLIKGRLIGVNITEEITKIGFRKVALLKGTENIKGELKDDFIYRRIGQFVGRQIFVFKKS